LRRWLPLLIVVAVLLAGFSRLRFDADPLGLLPADLPAVAALRLHQQLFADSREILVALEAPTPEDASRFAEAVSRDLGAMTNRVASVRWEFSPRDSMVETVAWMWLQRPTVHLAALESQWESPRLQSTIAEARERLATSLNPLEIARTSHDPLGLLNVPEVQRSGGGSHPGHAMFSNPLETFRLVMVRPKNPAMSYREADECLGLIRERIEGIRKRLAGEQVEGRWRFALTGAPAFLAETASGMESDLRWSVASTLLVICLLFGLAHRSLRPLGLLVVALGLTLLLTLALGGLFLGTLNVISCGFAAVMMGLVVDYALVGYQELRAHPGESLRQVYSKVGPGIGWSAVTTAGTFLSLGFVRLPGLAELGFMTALGLVVGAGVTLAWFLPRAASLRTRAMAVGTHAMGSSRSGELGISPRTTGLITAVLMAGCVAALVFTGPPRTEAGSGPLLPRKSAAQEAMDWIQRELGHTNPVTWLLIPGSDSGAVQEKLLQVEPILVQAREAGRIRQFEIPSGFWPHPAQANANLPGIRRLAERRLAIFDGLTASGFTSNSFLLTAEILDHWARWSSPGAHPPLWPTNDAAQWLAGQIAGRTPGGGWVALGTVESATPAFRPDGLPPEVQVASWERLGPALLSWVRQRVAWLTVGILGVLIVCLWLAFRRASEVLLALGALGLSFAILISIMSLAGASWNLLNLIAIPLLLGTSVDSAIHVQLAMRRHQGDLRAVWRTTGIALLLCAGANVAGFGSLAWSSNAGLASLDVVCAGGVLCVLAVMLLLLPLWWLAIHRDDRTILPASSKNSGPSSLYGGPLWNLAGLAARHAPRPLLVGLARWAARGYALMRPARREIVLQNLLPVLEGDRAAAERATRENFDRFAEKLVDLWRLEFGANRGVPVEPAGGWDTFDEAVASGRGVLLVTVHLGNWELGGPLLTRLGSRPLILSAPEPDPVLTEMRIRARARLGVDSLIVGADPFAFVEVIQRLQEGRMVALLLDRPPKGGVEVTLFGRPIQASPAAADLARATGCRIVPVFVVRQEDSYRAFALSAVDYDWALLGTAAARQELTGRILRVFEPAIRQFPGQWFHFVPVWNPSAPSAKGPA